MPTCPNCNEQYGRKQQLQLAVFKNMMKTNPILASALEGTDGWCINCIKEEIDPYMPDWVKGKAKPPEEAEERVQELENRINQASKEME